MSARFTLVASLLGLLGCASSTQNTVTAASRWPPRLQQLDAVIANAEQFPCTAGLHSIPASVVETGVFANVPYQSFSNGNVEVNAYGDPGDLVGLEAGTQAQDPALQQCLIQFVAAQTLSDTDKQRVERFTPTPALDVQPGLNVEVTPPTAPDAFNAWWVSLERTEAIAEAKAPPEQIQQMAQPAAQWQPPPATYYRRPPRPVVVYRSYRPAPVRVYPPRFNRRGGVYLRIR